MGTQLTVLLGADFDTRLIRGLVRNGRAVLWHYAGVLPRGLRRGHSGIDWVYRGSSARLWEHLIEDRVRGDADRCIILAEAPGPARENVLGVDTGILPWPAGLRQLLSILKRSPVETGNQLGRFCQEIFGEWETVQRAKETLIRHRGCSESEAYAALRRMSMDGCITLPEAARSIMTGENGRILKSL